MSDLGKISQTGTEWHAGCGDMVEIETGSIIPIWRTFGRIQCHVIPEPRATLQGERIPSAILKIVFRRILFFVLLLQFRLRRAAAFASSTESCLYLVHDVSVQLRMLSGWQMKAENGECMSKWAKQQQQQQLSYHQGLTLKDRLTDSSFDDWRRAALADRKYILSNKNRLRAPRSQTSRLQLSCVL